MAVNERLNDRIRALLTGIRGVTEKRMFRGTAFLVKGKLCITAGDDTIMCRIGPHAYTKALTRTGARPVIMRGRTVQGYVYVDAEGIGTAKQLASWVRLALAYDPAATPSKRQRKAAS